MRIYTAQGGEKWATGDELRVSDAHTVEAAKAEASIEALNNLKLPLCKVYETRSQWPDVDFGREIPIGTAWVWSARDSQAWLRLDWEGNNDKGVFVEMRNLISTLSISGCLDEASATAVMNGWKRELWERHRKEFTRTLSRGIDEKIMRDVFFSIVSDDFSAAAVKRLLPRFITDVKAAVAGTTAEKPPEELPRQTSLFEM